MGSQKREMGCVAPGGKKGFLNYTCEISSFNVSVIPSLNSFFCFDRDKTGTIFRGKISGFYDFKM